MELLIALAILAVVTAIAIPVYNQYRRNALLSKIQQNLVNCASELTAEYADGGVKTKLCTVPGVSGGCTLTIAESGDFIKFQNDFCDFVVEGRPVRCYISSSFGSVNGFIRCEFQ